MENSAIQIKMAEHPQDFSEAKKLILDYVTWLGIDLSFQNWVRLSEGLGAAFGVLSAMLMFHECSN